MALLRAAYFGLAIQLQEASAAMSSNEMRDGLQNAISAAHDGDPAHSGHSHQYVDHTGDEASGDCIFTCDPDGDGDTDYVSAPYSKGTDSSNDDYSIDTDNGKQVAMRSSWEDVPDEADHYAAMQEAKLYTPGPIVMCERFVSKKERDAAGSGDFAGKGKSFPILKAADVDAAFHSLGRAGSDNHSVATIRANIIRIAKAKGFPLPKSAQDGGDDKTKEAKGATSTGLRLCESASTLEAIVLREAKADYEIKLIAPGKGSSAFYPAEVLKRDGPKVFGPGTHVYVNHPTAAEEAARPEGDVKNLAGVLTTAAAYHESHAKGPGLYARMKVFADHGQMVEEKAPHVGMSIRASGIAESGKKQDGLPILKELTGAESVDVVTRAGAGGMILSEAARTANPKQEAAEMSAEEVQKLVEAGIQKARLPELARNEATRLLEKVAFKPKTKAAIVESVCLRNIPVKENALDVEAFGKIVVAEAQRVGEMLAEESGAGRIAHMGIPGLATPAQPKPEEISAREAAAKSDLEAEVKIYESLGMSKRAAEFAAKGRDAA